MTSPTEQSDGGFDAERRTKREAWAAMTAGQRLAWLEEALDLAHHAGALVEERRRRQQAADDMAEQFR